MRNGWAKAMLMVLALSGASPLMARPHNNAWFRGTLSVPVAPKVKVDAEFQHRRQSGFDSGHGLDRNLMFSFRTWAHYRYRENVRLSISPFAYFCNYKIVQRPGDETLAPGREIRLSAAGDLQQGLFDNMYIVDRAAVEYRILENGPSLLLRLRNRLGFRYDLTKKVDISVFDELLFNVSGAPSGHFFDHNRLGSAIGYKVAPYLKADMGYVYIVRLPLTGSTNLRENNIYLNVTFLLPG